LRGVPAARFRIDWQRDAAVTRRWGHLRYLAATIRHDLPRFSWIGELNNKVTKAQSRAERWVAETGCSVAHPSRLRAFVVHSFWGVKKPEKS